MSNTNFNILKLTLKPFLKKVCQYHSLFDSHINFGNLLWGCAANKNIKKKKTCKKGCVRNVALKHFKAHTEPLFKSLSILKFPDKLSYCKSIFMNQYSTQKLPESFRNIHVFTDITCTDDTQTRHNDYNYLNKAATKRNAFNSGGAHLTIAHPLRLLSTQELQLRLGWGANFFIFR